ncbi:MAG: PorV/PorQ family protein [Ignavibacteriaceae bacterium]
MRKTLLIFIISAASMFAQSAGNSGLSFLKLGFGARNVAMGDAGAAASSDVTSLFYNPANLSDAAGNQIMLMHNEWIQGIRSEILGAKTDLFGIPFALGLNVTSVNDIPIRTQATPDPIASFNAEYFFGSISTGFHLVDNISFGATIKYLYEGLYVDEATGWGFDFGLNYKTPIDGLSAVAVIRNLGSMNQLRNQNTKLPTEIRFGPEYKFGFPDSKIGVNVAAEFLKYTPNNDSHFNLGAEVIYDNLISLRGGYQSNYFSKNFTGGLGIMWGDLNFDYAFSPFQYGLGTGNSLSLSLKF